MTGRSARVLFTALLALLFALRTSAQRPPAQPNAAEILHRMQKLNVLGSVLYIAAHPDDENTRLIAWLANGKKVRTGYLSLTRGEGGQNLIGPELGDALGIIRTQELLEARRIDGGEQFFTRAVDFGFSKNAKESFEKWGHDEVLSDVVRVIRTFRPDIIITRFPPTREAGHGHHEASAILAEEAFKAAGDPLRFPGCGEAWQPRRLFFNGSTFWKQDLAEYVKKDTVSDWYTVDVGGYDPLLGLSYTEIAGRSRSMHKSQGFGAAETKGELIEYLKLIAGDKPKTKDIFEGIDMTWKRVPKSDRILQLVNELKEAYSPSDPSKSLDALKTLLAEVERSIAMVRLSKENYFLLKKQTEIGELIEACAGTAFEVLSSTTYLPLGNPNMELRLTLLERGPRPLDLALRVLPGLDVLPLMEIGKALRLDTTITIPAPSNFDQPYWLIEPHRNLYKVIDWNIGRPRISNSILTGLFLNHAFTGESEKTLLSTSELMYHWVDRVAGERIRPVYVTPIASLDPKAYARMSGGNVTVEVRALKDGLTGKLEATNTSGYIYSPLSFDIGTMKKDERKSFTFACAATDKVERGGILSFKLTSGDQVADKTLHEIDYPHIMPQVYYTPAEVKLIPLDVKVNAKTVGYIKGAGDDVPQAIEQLGVRVEMIDPATATLESLGKYDAVVTGIRAYNTVQAMKAFNPILLKYVENGGTLVVQYNTLSRDMVLPDSLFGPYPFKLTRDRVTVEEATCTLLKEDHPLLTYPNKISPADFEGWVQERGLYFCGSLDPRYTPLLSWSDPGEDPLNGALITTDYGKGRYVYTSISFFRELPAGVPGAYRLFANLISKRTQ